MKPSTFKPVHPTPSRRLGKPPPRVSRITLLMATLLLAATAAVAGEIEVRVSGENMPPGIIGCALHSTEAGFPMDSSRARQVWLPWQPQGVTCRFSEISSGRHAVSVINDRNGNRRIDTNFLGIPLEPWGVSNNVRPLLRPPTFGEAAFQFDGGALRIDVRIEP